MELQPCCILRNRTILLVDGKPPLRAVPGPGALRNALIAQGSHVIDLQSGSNALDVLGSRPVDLILLDTNLPATLGVEICRSIRTGWDVPIIVVSACGSASEKVEALDGGADDFLSRPFTLDELLARIRAALRRTGFATGGLPMRAPVRLPCGHYLPEDHILGLAARIRDSHREPMGAGLRPAVGRPKKIVICRKCGASGGTLEMRSHKCAVRAGGLAFPDSDAPPLSAAH